jgi:DnaJ family protein A protein 5
LAEYVLPEWAQSRDNDEDHGEFSLSEEDEVIEEIECVVCNKTFRSEKQFEAHEKSKKHIKAVQQLRRQMQKENANLDLQDSEPVMSPSPTARAQPGEDDTPDAVISAHHGDYDERIEDARSITGQEDTNHGTPSQPDSEDDDYAPRSEVEERISNGPHTGTKSTNTGLSTPDAMESAAASLDGLTLGNGKDEGRKVGKAKLKREKKAARQAAEAQASVSIQQLLQSNTRPLHRVDADL